MRLFATRLGHAAVLASLACLGSIAEAQIGVRGWPQFAGDPQHTGRSFVAADDIMRIRWSTSVDTAPGTLIHYGAPVITPSNTVVVTVKTTSTGGFKVEGHDGVTGATTYSEPTDYVIPSGTGWIPPCGSALTSDNRLVTPAIGGTVLIRSNADDPGASVTRVAFYGISNYNANPSAFNSGVKINTPIVSDAQGNVYFGFITGANPLNIPNGIARIAPDGTGTWASMGTLTGSSGEKPMQNAAPALSNDGASLYAVSAPNAFLVRVNSNSLALMGSRQMTAPDGPPALAVQSSACPLVGPDGDVYFGVAGGAHSRGWMLHYDGGLTTQKPTGAFGWDNTASVVPTSMVPQYGGTSTYLIMTKYNDYATGQHKVAVLDPDATMTDPVTGVPVMNAILTQLGPTPLGGGVYEWCVNNAAVDPLTDSVLVNSEDGSAYRWNLGSNQITQAVRLTNGVGEAYTMTSVGPDGTVYVINNELMFALSNNAVPPTSFSVLRGAVVSGDLTSLLYSDDNRLAVRPGLAFNSSLSPIQVLLSSTSFSTSASSISFSLESQASAPNIQQRIELMNFVTGSYESVDVRTASLSDSVANVLVAGDPNRFINAVTGAIQARVSYTPTGIFTGANWQARLDQAAWTVNP